MKKTKSRKKSLNPKKYLEIAKHYEGCLAKHGPTYKGMDWPNEKDAKTRYEVMSRVSTSGPVPMLQPHILDIGCGVGLLKKYLEESGIYYPHWYTGIDVSEKMIKRAKKINNKDPFYRGNMFITQDILKKPLRAKSYDYVIMNGVLTEKVSLTQKQMVKFAQDMIKAAFKACRKGIAFNVMSKHVDWERKDLFHWSMEECVAFLTKECSRHIVVRADYGLWEYSVYCYRKPKA